MIEPGAAARCMPFVQLVLCAAHAVGEDGGAICDIGALTLAHVAAAHRVPFCVAAPHYTFRRAGTPGAEELAPPLPLTSGPPSWQRPTRDATPARLVTWFFTDVGVMPPSAVVDWQLSLSSRGGG